MQRHFAIPAALIGLFIVILGVSSMAIARSLGHHATATPTVTLVPTPSASATPRPHPQVRLASPTPTDTPLPTATVNPTSTGSLGVSEPIATPTATATTQTTPTPSTEHSQALVVVLDPGHGGQNLYGDESGAANGTLLEKDLTLATAKIARRYLRSWGYRVYLTRTTDQRVNWPQRDLNHDGKIDHIDEYDARTLFANRHHADVFVSIHYDGSTDPASHGTHGYYCPARPFWRSSDRLARILTQSVSSTVTQAGYSDPNNGFATDVSDVVPQSRADYPWFLVLGPSRPRWLTGTAMPGALIESMYVSSPADAAALRRPAILNAVGLGYAKGIRTYFHGRHTRHS